MSVQRSPHLQAMGIEQWVRRGVPAGVPSPEPLQPAAVQVAESAFMASVSLQGAAGSPLMLITPPLQAEAEQLLVAMLGAINVDVDDCYRLCVSDPALLSDPGFAPFLQQQVADSGSRLQLQLGAAAPLLESLFHCADPAHLLAHPEEKRGAWEVLKRLRHQLQQ